METYRNLRFVDSRMHTVYLIRTIQWNIPDTLHMRELSLLLHPYYYLWIFDERFNILHMMAIVQH